jgi:hypothetical protein
MEETKPETLQGLKEGDEVPLSDNIEITELHCHECNNYIKFALDKGKNGQHVVICPKCGHEHCRTILNGVVTGDRWESRNKDVDLPSQIQYTTTPVWYVTVSQENCSGNGWQVVTPTTGDPALLNSWGNTDNCSINITNGTTYIYYGGGTVIS